VPCVSLAINVTEKHHSSRPAVHVNMSLLVNSALPRGLLTC
jgi:hypothetical protein